MTQITKFTMATMLALAGCAKMSTDVAGADSSGMASTDSGEAGGDDDSDEDGCKPGDSGDSGDGGDGDGGNGGDGGDACEDYAACAQLGLDGEAACSAACPDLLDDDGFPLDACGDAQCHAICNYEIATHVLACGLDLSECADIERDACRAARAAEYLDDLTSCSGADDAAELHAEFLAALDECEPGDDCIGQDVQCEPDGDPCCAGLECRHIAISTWFCIEAN